MRVLCIGEGPWVQKCKFLWVFPYNKHFPGPDFGDELTVIDEDKEEEEHYEFQEWPEYAYEKKWFIPLTGEKEESVEEFNIRIADHIEKISTNVP